jgi:hypothetical protein
MNAFVRGLWGDAEVYKWPGVLADAAETVLKAKHPQSVTYTCGPCNTRFLQTLGVQVQELWPEPVPVYPGPRDANDARKPAQRGQINYGVSMWRVKLWMIREAVASYDAAVWLDWDCRMSGRLPPDFWETMAKRAPLQAGLRRLTHPTLPWREGELGCYVPHGAFIYCRSPAIAERLIAIHEANPTWLDEHCIAKWIEETWGRPWQSGDEKRWDVEGYEPYCYDHRKLVWHKKWASFRE